MPDPHAHHILFKKGHGATQQALVEEGQAILSKYGIDPIYGRENLVWAPWRVSGQHDRGAVEAVVDKLKEADQDFGTKEAILAALQEMGGVAARRSK